jgi:hypothetical protein
MTDTLQNKTTLKSWFQTGDIPTESQFNDLITTLVAEGGDSGTNIGAIQVGNQAYANAAGAIAIGSNVVASNVSSVIFGIDAVNDEYISLQIGANGPRLCGNGVPSIPKNGDIWVSGSTIYGYSNSAANAWGGGGGSGNTYTTYFTSSNVVANNLTVTHNLNSKYCVVAVYDNTDEMIMPDSIIGTSNVATTINLASFTITGTWNVRIMC